MSEKRTLLIRKREKVAEGYCDICGNHEDLYECLVCGRTVCACCMDAAGTCVVCSEEEG